MKKIALTSLLTIFAVSGAHAGNVIDGNPLYMPGENHFYSVTSLESHTKNDTPWTLGEDFGYGITDNFAVEVSTSVSENKAFDEYSWDDLGLTAMFRALDMGEWKLDLIGAYGVDGLYNHPKIFNDAWFDENATNYIWMAGVRGGYVTHDWTLAGHALFTYMNTESFNWNEDAGKEGVHALSLGLDGQYVIDSNWSVLAGVEYTGYLDKEWRGIPGAKIKNAGEWFGELGVNYNIDSQAFVGAYINGSLNHRGGNNNDEWEWDDGFGFGAKFGVDF